MLKSPAQKSCTHYEIFNNNRGKEISKKNQDFENWKLI